MKNIFLAVILAITATSCMASKARENGLLPAMNLAWPGVQADIERGIVDAVEDGELTDRMVIDFEVAKLEVALQSGLSSDFRLVLWTDTLQPYAQRGIQDRIEDGEMSEMVANSLRERLRNFSIGMSKMGLVTYRHPTSSENEEWLPDGTRISGGYAVALDGTSQRLTVTN